MAYMYCGYYTWYMLILLIGLQHMYYIMYNMCCMVFCVYCMVYKYNAWCFMCTAWCINTLHRVRPVLISFAAHFIIVNVHKSVLYVHRISTY